MNINKRGLTGKVKEKQYYNELSAFTKFTGNDQRHVILNCWL